MKMFLIIGALALLFVIGSAYALMAIGRTSSASKQAKESPEADDREN